MFFHKIREPAFLDQRLDISVAAAMLVFFVFVVMPMIMAAFAFMRMPVGLFVSVTALMSMVVFILVVTLAFMPVMFPVVPAFALVFMFMPVLAFMSVFMAMLLFVMRMAFVRMRFAVMLLLLMFVGRTLMDAEFDAGDVPARAVLEMHVEVSNVQFRQFPFESGGLHAKISERADGHIAANTGKTV